MLERMKQLLIYFLWFVLNICSTSERIKTASQKWRERLLRGSNQLSKMEERSKFTVYVVMHCSGLGLCCCPEGEGKRLYREDVTESGNYTSCNAVKQNKKRKVWDRKGKCNNVGKQTTEKDDIKKTERYMSKEKRQKAIQTKGEVEKRWRVKRKRKQDKQEA